MLSMLSRVPFPFRNMIMSIYVPCNQPYLRVVIAKFPQELSKFTKCKVLFVQHTTWSHRTGMCKHCVERQHDVFLPKWRSLTPFLKNLIITDGSKQGARLEEPGSHSSNRLVDEHLELPKRNSKHDCQMKNGIIIRIMGVRHPGAFV